MHKLLLLALGLAHAKTEYRSALQIGRERAAAWYYGPLGLQDIQATIAFIGDSTHRNQLQFLCDVLGTAPRAIATGASSTGLACAGRGITAALRVFDGESDPWTLAKMRSVLRSLARGADVRSWDIVYFGSTALHMLQLLPLSKWRGWPAARDLDKELVKAVEAVRSVGACPIFMTSHWLCSQQFLRPPDGVRDFPSEAWSPAELRGTLADETLPWAARKAAILRTAARNASYFPRECAVIARSSDEADVCARLTFDAAGSAHAASLERAALAKLPSPIRVVDAHALTRDQCWATQRDGVQYLPLLPSRLAVLTSHVADCLRERRPRSSAHNT